MLHPAMMGYDRLWLFAAGKENHLSRTVTFVKHVAIVSLRVRNLTGSFLYKFSLFYLHYYTFRKPSKNAIKTGVNRHIFKMQFEDL